MEAEHFIERMERGDDKFVFEQNPFQNDIAGKKIDGLELGDELLLSPDVSTLRIAPWLKNEAFVIANLSDEYGKEIEYCPRRILKGASGFKSG